jgi:integrase
MQNYRLQKYNQRPNWYVCWTEDGRTQRVSTGTTVRAEAEVFLRDFVAGRLAPPPPDRITVAFVIDHYLGKLTEEKRARQNWNLKHVRRLIGDLMVDEIDERVCRDYLASRVREKSSLSQATLRDELRALRTALIRAERDNIILKAPWVEAPGKAGPRERFLTEDEISRLMAACLRTKHLWTFVTLALNTGARSRAILELTWDRVDMERGLIDYRVPGRAQTKKGRAIVPMNGVVRLALSSVPAEERTGTVVKYAGHRINGVKHAFARACKRAGLEGVTPHTLRHTFATIAAESGVDLRRIGKALGHADERTTERYAKYSPDYLRDVVEAVGRRVK